MDEAEIATHLTSFIEVQYNLNGEIPPLKNLLEKVTNYSEAKLRNLLETSINPKLKARGVPQYKNLKEVPKQTQALSFKFDANTDFDPDFILACNIILDPADTRTFNAKIKFLAPVGVTTNRWNTWMKIPRYQSYAEKVFYERFDKTLDMQADMALARNIQAGDLQSIKYYKELTGKFVQRDQNSLALGALITVFMEIISKHLDHSVIDVVAEELENSPVGDLFRLPGEVKQIERN